MKGAVVFLLLFGMCSCFKACSNYKSCRSCLSDKRCIFYQSSNFEYLCGNRQAKYSQVRRIFRLSSRCNTVNATLHVAPTKPTNPSTTELSYYTTPVADVGSRNPSNQEEKSIPDSTASWLLNKTHTQHEQSTTSTTTNSTSHTFLNNESTTHFSTTFEPITEFVNLNTSPVTPELQTTVTPDTTIRNNTSVVTNDSTTTEEVIDFLNPFTNTNFDVLKSSPATPELPPTVIPATAVQNNTPVNTNDGTTMEEVIEVLNPFTTPDTNLREAPEIQPTLIPATTINNNTPANTNDGTTMEEVTTPNAIFSDESDTSLQKVLQVKTGGEDLIIEVPTEHTNQWSDAPISPQKTDPYVFGNEETTLATYYPTPIPKNKELTSAQDFFSTTQPSQTNRKKPGPQFTQDYLKLVTRRKSKPKLTSRSQFRSVKRGKKIGKLTQNGLEKKIKQHACILAYLQRVYGQSLMGNSWFKFSISNPMVNNYRECSKMMWGRVIQI